MRDPAPPIRRRGGFFPGLALVAVAALGLSGCEVTATVGVDVSGQGGEVAAAFLLDEDALGVFGSDRDEAVAALVDGADADGLRKAGWTVGSPRRPAGGGVEIRLTKEFGRPDDLGRIIEELSGSAGPLSEFRLRRERKLTAVDYRLEGTVDARALTGLGNAPGLLARLEDAGVDSRRLAEMLAGRATEGFRVRLVADLPGGTRANTTQRDGGRPVWQAEGDETVSVRATASQTDLTRPVLFGLAALLAIGALVTLRARRPARPGPPLG
jgi:hypothetical protein